MSATRSPSSHLANGRPAFTLVGLQHRVREARDECERAAKQPLDFPSDASTAIWRGRPATGIRRLDCDRAGHSGGDRQSPRVLDATICRGIVAVGEMRPGRVRWRMGCRHARNAELRAETAVLRDATRGFVVPSERADEAHRRKCRLSAKTLLQVASTTLGRG